MSFENDDAVASARCLSRDFDSIGDDFPGFDSEEAGHLARVRGDDARPVFRIDLFRAAGECVQPGGIDDQRLLDSVDDVAHERVAFLIIAQTGTDEHRILLLQKFRDFGTRPRGLQRIGHRLDRAGIHQLRRFGVGAHSNQTSAGANRASRAHHRRAGAARRSGDDADVPVRAFVCARQPRGDVRADVGGRGERQRNVLVLNCRVGNGDVGDDDLAAKGRRRLEDVAYLRRRECNCHRRLHAWIERFVRGSVRAARHINGDDWKRELVDGADHFSVDAIRSAIEPGAENGIDDHIGIGGQNQRIVQRIYVGNLIHW